MKGRAAAISIPAEVVVAHGTELGSEPGLELRHDGHVLRRVREVGELLRVQLRVEEFVRELDRDASDGGGAAPKSPTASRSAR